MKRLHVNAGPMTVKELIARLQDMPQEASVFLSVDGAYATTIDVGVNDVGEVYLDDGSYVYTSRALLRRQSTE